MGCYYASQSRGLLLFIMIDTYSDTSTLEWGLQSMMGGQKISHLIWGANEHTIDINNDKSELEQTTKYDGRT